MEFTLKNGVPTMEFEKAVMTFGPGMNIDGYDIDYPGEYEKSGIIVQIKEYGDDYLITRCNVGDRVVAYLPESTEDLTSDMISFLGDVDVLILPGKKTLQKIVETVDPRVVLPYGEALSAFFGAFGQTVEPLNKKNLKVTDFVEDSILFLDLQG